jgi:hypothetical protein
MSISFRDFDYLSPKISLFYYGRHRHSSDLGAFLTIIMIFFCFVFIFYSFSEVYLHTSSTIQYYRHFFKEEETFIFNNTQGIFHFFHIFNPQNHQISSINLKNIRFFMSYIQEDYRRNPSMLSENDHWVYDHCRNGIDNQYISKDLFNNVSFDNGLCLRYYYNSNDKIYYPIERTEKFIYPNINSSGMNMDYSVGTIIEKCSNDSILTQILGNCSNEEEIDNYIKDNYGFNINILTNQISPGNYQNQINKYFLGIASSIKNNKYFENNLILSPLKLDMRKGLFFPITYLNKTYTFDENYIIDEDRGETSRVLSTYNFCLSKSGYVYKSSYLTIYDSFHKIGGIVQLIYYIFFGLNFVYNRYIIIKDTKKLFFIPLKENNKGVSQIQNFTNIAKNLRQKYRKYVIKKKKFKKKIKNYKKEKIN